MNKEKPETAESDSGPAGADDDDVSDPAKSDDASGDWSDEGGATPSGPADTGDHTQSLVVAPVSSSGVGSRRWGR